MFTAWKPRVARRRTKSLDLAVTSEGTEEVLRLVLGDVRRGISHNGRTLYGFSSEPEPQNRATEGALKATHRSFGFLEEVTGMPLSERRTKSKLYDVILRELLSTALPGKPAQQAPRFPIKVLTAVESFVVDETKPAYMRMYAWWVLLQNWCTLRFFWTA